MAKRLLLLLEKGFEETEVVVPTDILRRAGVEVILASTGDGNMVEGAHGIGIRPDGVAWEISRGDWETLLLPGGPAVAALRKNHRAMALIRGAAGDGKWLAAICAAPILLKDAELLEGKRFTIHPSLADELPPTPGEGAVVEDGNLITASGPGAAAEFALAIARRMVGPAIAEKTRMAMGW